MDFFEEMLTMQYGENVKSKIIDGLSKRRYTTFRVNNLKSSFTNVQNELDINQITYKKVDWYNDAYIVLNGENKIKTLNIYKNGEIYIQSLSSMIPPIILGPKEKENILDMTAAPRKQNNSNCQYFRK